VLEFALDFLERGDPSPELMARSEVIQASTTDLRNSFTAYVLEALETPPGPADPHAAALQATYDLDTNRSDFHVDLSEMFAASERLRSEGLESAANEMLWAAGQVFPRDYGPWNRLATAQLAVGDQNAALISFERASSVNRRSYPWERTDAETADALLEGKRILAAELGGATSGDEGAAILQAFRADPDAWYANETALNALGYRLLREEMPEAAIDVFTVNAEVSPGSANVWDSLGDGYRAAGDIDAAIASYRKALQVDPTFAASRRNLQQLERARQ
jgi:tetratricopeptide (TPR) repeat protein